MHDLAVSLAQTRRRLVDADIAVTDVGNGPAVVLVHVGLWSFVWRDLARALATDHRVVTFDGIASGASGADRAPTIAANAGVLAALLEELDLHRVTLVGHDLGGLVAWQAAARQRERIAGLVAINTFGWPPEGRALRGMLRLMGSRWMRWFSGWLLPRMTASTFGVGRHLDGNDRRAFLAPWRGRPEVRRTFATLMRDAARSDAGDRADEALRGPLADLPLLTVFGERNDPFGFAEEWRRRFPDAVQHTVPGGNHFPMCDAPDDVARWIRDFHSTRVAPSPGAARS